MWHRSTGELQENSWRGRLRPQTRESQVPKFTHPTARITYYTKSDGKLRIYRVIWNLRTHLLRSKGRAFQFCHHLQIYEHNHRFAWKLSNLQLTMKLFVSYLAYFIENLLETDCIIINIQKLPYQYIFFQIKLYMKIKYLIQLSSRSFARMKKEPYSCLFPHCLPWGTIKLLGLQEMQH